MPAVEADHPARRGKRFVISLLWNWLGVGTGLVTGLILSPYLIRKLGAEAYGLWSLSFALVENYVFLDFGFRSATVKYVAHYWATKEPDRINEVLNTVLLYAAMIATGLFAISLAGSTFLDRIFQISPAFRSSFRVLVILVSASWCLGFIFNTFAASLEAVQRYDLYNKTAVLSTLVRAVGLFILLYRGHGLVAIGILSLSTQSLGYLLYFLSFRRIFPALRLSVSLASRAVFRKMGSFGIHSFVANISNLALTQTTPLLIGHFMPAAFVGYYGLPIRLLLYTGDAVGRVGIITNANTAELQARGDTRSLPDLAVYTNRYCVVLFMPLAIFFWIYGWQLFQRWVPLAADYSAPLLPILLIGYMIGVIGQFSSGMLLQGLGRHQRYGRGLLVEAIASVALLVWVIPRYGLLGTAWCVSALMILNRGLFTPWLVSHEMGFSFLRFLRAIYARAFLSAVPAIAVAYLLQRFVLPGATWIQLFAAIPVIAMAYYSIAFFTCLPRSHRELIEGWLKRRLKM